MEQVTLRVQARAPHPSQLVPELEKQARRKPEVPQDISNLAVLEALFAK